MKINVKYSNYDKKIEQAYLKIDEDKKIDFQIIEEEEQIGEDEEQEIIINKYFKITSIDESIGMELEAKLDIEKLDEMILLFQRMKKYM